MTAVVHEEASECRIINVQLLSRHIDNLTQHVATCSACQRVAQSSDSITIVGEKDHNGLASIMDCKFKGCGQELTFATSTKTTGLTGKMFWTNNLAAVWGQMTVGGGFNSLEESFKCSKYSCDDTEILHSHRAYDRKAVVEYFGRIHDICRERRKTNSNC